MEDCKLDDRVECFVAWLVDENPVVGDESDDIVVDEVIYESIGLPVTDVRYRSACAISILCKEVRFEPYLRFPLVLDAGTLDAESYDEIPDPEGEILNPYTDTGQYIYDEELLGGGKRLTRT